MPNMRERINADALIACHANRGTDAGQRVAIRPRLGWYLCVSQSQLCSMARRLCAPQRKRKAPL